MQLYTSLDIGNDQIKIIVASVNENTCNVLASTSFKSNGLKKNTVYDEKKFKEALHGAIVKTEEKIGMKIKELLLCVPANNASMTIESGLVDIKEDMVRGEDIKRVLKDASNNTYDNSRELVSVLPISFTVDEEVSVSDPKGQSGDKLFTKAVVGTSPKNEIYPFIEAVRSQGIDIVDIVYNTQADYSTISSKELDRKMGAIINIGADVTTTAIFNKGIMIKNSYIPLGSSSVDKDISFVYKVDIKTSRKLKETFSLSGARFSDVNEEVEVLNAEGKKIRLNQTEVSKVVEARLNEILKLAKNEINRLTKREISYIIVVGGISELAGFNYIVEDVLGKNASCWNMQELGARHNKYTSAFGAIKYYSKKCALMEEKIQMFSPEMIKVFLSPKKKSVMNESMVHKFFSSFF